MKIKEIQTGRVMDVSDSYGARLIEQGKAVIAPAVANTEAKIAKKPVQKIEKPKPLAQEKDKSDAAAR